MKTNLIGGSLFAAVLAISAPVWAQGTVVTDDKTQTTVQAPKNGTTEVRTAPNGDTIITVTVNEEPVAFDEAPPRMIGGRVMVPLRGVVERLGGTIQYDAKSKVITGGHEVNNKQFRLRVGSADSLVNGTQMSLDAPPRVFSGVTYVPLRFVSEAMGANVSWDNVKRTVVIEAAGNVAEVKPGT